MPQLVILLVVALVLGAIAVGVTLLIRGADPGLQPAEPDGRAVPLPSRRPLTERDVTDARFDVSLRGYRMAQVDRALDRAAYDIGYKDELIGVLEAEIDALRAGRADEADALRRIRLSAAGPDDAGQARPALAANPPTAEVVTAPGDAGPAPAAGPDDASPAAGPDDAAPIAGPDDAAPAAGPPPIEAGPEIGAGPASPADGAAVTSEVPDPDPAPTARTAHR